MKKSSKKTFVTDMTVGNPTKHILLFAIPLMIGNFFQQLYNTIDSLVVGKYVSSDALAATGSCSSICFIFFGFSSGLAIGIGIIISQYYGGGDEKGIRATVGNSIYILVTASLIVSALGILLARPILTIMDTPPEILEDAVLYLRTTCCGILFIAIYNGVAAVLRALGDSRTPLIFLIISAFLNIGFDLLFVLVFNLGVFGVAFATVIAQFISAALSLGYAIWKVPYFRLAREELAPHKQIIIRSFKLGIPIALQSSLIAFSLIVLQRKVNSFGINVMAAYTITGKVDVISSQLYNALATSLTTFCGQNLGANKLDRVKMGYLRGALISAVYNCVIVPIIILMASPITAFFVNDSAVIEFSSQVLKISTVFYFALGMIYVPRGVLNGCGDARFSLINGISEVVCRIVFATLFTEVINLGSRGIWWATGFTWLVVAVVCNLRYLQGKWKYIKTVGR